MKTNEAGTENNTGWMLLGLVVLLLVGAVLRIYRVDSGLWFDEIRTVISSVRSPLLEIVTHYPSNNDHLLYSVLAHLSVSVFGEHPWSLRLPALVFGIASIPMLYLLGRTVTSRFDALMATLMLTFSYHHIWFTQNARGYTALLFWVMLATYLLLQWYSHGRKTALVGYAIVAALGSYTHLTMVFVVISHALVMVWVVFVARVGDHGWKQPAAAFIAAGLLTFILYSPMLLDMKSFFSGTAGKETVETPVWALLAALRGLHLGLGGAFAVLLAVMIFTVGMLGYLLRNRVVLALFLLPGVVTLIVALAMGRPVYPRFLFFLMGFVLLIVVEGASSLGQWFGRHRDTAMRQRYGRITAGLLAAGVVAVSVKSLPYGYAYPKQDYVQAMDYIVENRDAGDRVAVVGITSTFPFIEYYRQPWDQIDNAAQLQQLRSSGDTVWVLYTFPVYLDESVPDLKQQILDTCEAHASFHGTVAGGDIAVFRCPPVPRTGQPGG
ncbi:MAG TPA: glycosyltransferase family 39 protein [Gammaproteobacteria bacterium]|nr:glycosyltransferase family 39 protein [Gammaproteobacteria bacterium]